MTVVLDGFDPDAVSVAYVYYAAHNGGQWYGANELAAAGSLDASGRHAKDYVAHGTHASYPTRCFDSCSTPPNVSWPWESAHDGGAAWAANDDGVCGTECVKRLNQDWWANWLGRWGDTTSSYSFGWSPRSPGQQPRFWCTVGGYTSCDRPPGARSPFSAGHSRRVPSRRSCNSWFGGEVSVVACDPKVLGAAVRNHRMRAPGRLHLVVRGRRAGDSPGLAQAIGEPLVAGDRFAIRGKGTRSTVILAAIRVGLHLFHARTPYSRLPRTKPIRLRVEVREGVPVIMSGAHAIRTQITRVR